jgi:hypothetical protein
MSQQKKFPKKKVLIIAGAAVCVIAVLALVISVVGSFRAVKESAAPRAQNNDANDFALKCIGQLAKGDVNGVWLQLTQELQTQPNKELLKQMSEALGQAPKGDYVGSATHIMKDKQGIIYWYDYSIGPDNKQEMTVFVRQQRSDLVVEGLSLSFRDEDKMPIMMESSLCQKVYEDSAQSVFGAILGLAKTMFVVLIILAVVTTISEAIVFSKADEPAIAAFVPFYRYWVLARVGDRPGALGLATCFVSAIPYVGWLIAVGLFIYICIGIAAAFGRGILFGLGLCFLPFIFYPILAFSQK